jgi:hypothetical protein
MPDRTPDPAPDPFADRPFVIARVALAFEGGVGVFAWVLGYLVNAPALEPIAWRAADVAWALAACVPMWLLLLAILRWPAGPLRDVAGLLRTAVGTVFRRCTVAEMALISLAAGVGEEMLFRGVLQQGLARLWPAPWGVWAAIGVSSMLFGLAHCLTGSYAMLTALVSVYLGWLLVATENLLVPMVTHAAYDFVALVYLVRVRPARIFARPN